MFVVSKVLNNVYGATSQKVFVFGAKIEKAKPKITYILFNIIFFSTRSNFDEVCQRFSGCWERKLDFWDIWTEKASAVTNAGSIRCGREILCVVNGIDCQPNVRAY